LWISTPRLAESYTAAPGLRQFQLVPGEEHLTLRISLRSGADVNRTRAAAEHIVYAAAADSALCGIAQTAREGSTRISCLLQHPGISDANSGLR